MDIINKIDTFLNESMKDSDKKKIQELMKKYELMSLRAPLEKAGFKVDFAYTPIPYMKVMKGRESVIIVNKKYADDAEFTWKELSMGALG